MTFIEELLAAKNEGKLTEKVHAVILDLYKSYASEVDDPSIFSFLFGRVKDQIQKPYPFQSYHQKMRAPFDYYEFGLEFGRPLVQSIHIEHLKNVDLMKSYIDKKENVILFANHQTELDPQLFSLALEKTHPYMAEEVIFVAGDRVLTDPIAIPFSLGRNLLCIYSKRHIGNPPEKKHEKQLHNQKTMKRMKEMLSLGGQFIYVAPSGGRDRKNKEGKVVVSEFDPNNIEMFRLMAEHATNKTHFFPLALSTHDILPPPLEIENELGEMRKVKKTPIFFSFADEIDMEHIPIETTGDRIERRKVVSDYIWSIVNKEYQNLLKRK